MKSNNSTFWLYLLGIYIFLQFLWWAWMLIDLNQQIHFLETTVSNHLIEKNTPDSMLLKRKIIMIIGEGSVFMLLLMLGVFQVKKSMNKELEAAKRQHNFLLSVTHELNSPIAGVQLNLETVLNKKLSIEQKELLISNALNQNKRLKNLVENILTSTRLEENAFQINPVTANITELTNKIIDNFKIEKNNFILNSNSDNIFAKVDVLAYEFVLKNLIENAVKYSANTPIFIRLLDKPNSVSIEIEDQGIGVSDEKKQKIFDRFYRVQNEETRHTKGTGLGLYIAKNLIELMGGSISLKSALNKGSTFNITLKKHDN